MSVQSRGQRKEISTPPLRLSASQTILPERPPGRAHLLCLVSKRYCQIVTECLYECNDQMHPEGPGHSTIKAIGDLNPSLGQYVKSLSLVGEDFRWIDEGAWSWGYNGRARKLLARVLRSVVNVQNIYLSDPTDMSGSRCSIVEDYSWVEVFDDAVPPIKGWASEKSSSTVGILQMNNCALHNTVAAQIVESLKSLESFDYTHTTEHVWSSVASTSDPEAQLCWAEILMALSQHRLSLQNLGLGEITYDRKEGGLLGCMKDFINLERLRVELEMLVDLTIGDIDLGRTLPSSITSLSLEFQAESKFASLYGPAIASLGGSVFKQEKKFLQIYSDRSRMSLGQFKLSNHIRTLLDAGLITSLSETVGDKRTEFTLEQLLVVEDLIAFMESVFLESVGAASI
ncbi:hypothetical protein BKA63DRAFT_489744 [Paraphoma chrysanthemicola]|nr:hypothetical protein BKA63DRAFT_489744 [Paraphoma chrysanthemicola]